MKLAMMIFTLALLPLSFASAAPRLAMSTKCRKVSITLHPKPSDDELKFMLDKVVPDVPNPEVQNLCRSHIGEMRALLRTGSWETELSSSERQDLMGKLLNDCCERKK